VSNDRGRGDQRGRVLEPARAHHRAPGAASASPGHHDGARFDTAYYRSTHIPLAMKTMSAASVVLIEGVPLRGSPAPYAMIAHFEFPSAEAINAALASPSMAEVRADIARFTDITPTIMLGRS
jgi:uncharacterized protein (TIGR02118 family)